MKITFHGAAQTVTGSQHLVEVNGFRLLLDCGFYQGKRSEAERRNRSFPFAPKSVDAVILSHAHIDHSGNLPNLIKQGFAGPIYATSATADLSDIMLRDSGHIQESDAEFVNKRLRKGESPVQPIYTQADAEQVAGHFHSTEYGQRFEPIPGVTATFFDYAGHILGSAGLLLQIREHGRNLRFRFSGDIGRSKLPLLKDPVLPEPVDYVLMECTTGERITVRPGWWDP